METQQEGARPQYRPPAAGNLIGDMQFFLDIPWADWKVINGAFVPIRGWVWHPDGVETVEARTTRGTVPASVRFGRADVFKALGEHPYAFHTGFYLEVERDVWDGSAELWLETCNREWHRFHTVQVEFRDEEFAAAHEKMMKVLVCPNCHTRIEMLQPACRECGKPVEWMGEVPSFLGKRPSPLERGEPVSRHAVLENFATEYFDMDPGAIYLDAGAGWPPLGRPEIVQLEIERFPSTNVVADGAHLPFPSQTFDGIISHAVMEHVRDPFGYAQELMRVLKPGARFLCHSAFLQPVHAYPHHYFNTTLEGLKVLFKGARVIEAGVASFQRPWLALEWILRSYCHGFTDDAERERFKQMKIGDLLGDMKDDRPLRSFQSLTDEVNLELAAGVYILGEC